MIASFRIYDKMEKTYRNSGGRMFQIKNCGDHFVILATDRRYRIEYYSGFNEHPVAEGKRYRHIYDGDIICGVIGEQKIKGVMRVSDHEGIYIDAGNCSYDPFDFDELKIIGNANLDEVVGKEANEAIADFREN